MPRVLIVLFISSFCCLSLVVATSCYANNAEPLKIVVIKIGSPYQFKNEKGKDQGILVELTQLLVKNISFPSEISIVPYKRMIVGLEKGAYDCAMFFSANKWKEKFIQVGKISTKHNLLAFNFTEDMGTSPTSVADFDGKIVGSIRSAQHGDIIDNNNKIIKQAIENHHQGLRMLSSKHIDALIIGQEDIANLNTMTQGYFTVSSSENWLQCSRNSTKLKNTPNLLNTLSKAVKKLHHKDELLDPVSILHRKYILNYRRVN